MGPSGSGLKGRGAEGGRKLGTSNDQRQGSSGADWTSVSTRSARGMQDEQGPAGEASGCCSASDHGSGTHLRSAQQRCVPWTAVSAASSKALSSSSYYCRGQNMGAPGAHEPVCLCVAHGYAGGKRWPAGPSAQVDFDRKQSQTAQGPACRWRA